MIYENLVKVADATLRYILLYDSCFLFIKIFDKI